MPLSTRVILALRTILVLGAILAVIQGRYFAALTTLGIVGATLLPYALGRRFHVPLPPQMELLAVLFVYASLGLGEVHGYYERFWWWDALLHTGSGMLLGIFGFLLVHVMNEHERIAMHLKPGFVALFAFMFAVGLGALWEIFEFAADSAFGLNMQKSGLVDTMWDLIVDTVGALVISLLGWRDLRRGTGRWFLQGWIREVAGEDPEARAQASADERVVEGHDSSRTFD